MCQVLPGVVHELGGECVIGVDAFGNLNHRLHLFTHFFVGNADDGNVSDVLDMGCWTPVETVSVGAFPGRWQARALAEDGSRFAVLLDGNSQGEVTWNQLGAHNMHNALSAIAAARHAGVPVARCIEALCDFSGVKRRLELRGEVNGVTVYDDFAHHPTAIATTLRGLRDNRRDARLLAVLEPRSNTMRMGVHKKRLLDSLQQADEIYLLQPDNIDWNLADLARHSAVSATVHDNVAAIIDDVIRHARPGDHVIIMSNGGFGRARQTLTAVLQRTRSS